MALDIHFNAALNILPLALRALLETADDSSETSLKST